MTPRKAALNGKPRPASDYQVGYGRPPEHSRFAPGQSGNIKGRPKGSQNLSAIVARLARQQMTVKEGGRPRRVSRFEALYLTLWAQAYKGNAKAWTEIRQSLRDVGLLRSELPTVEPTITADDDAIVRDYLKQFGIEPPKSSKVNRNTRTRKAGKRDNKRETTK
jgi:hypothetical protein